MAAPMSFSQAKKTRLKNQDLSKKGSFDEEIVDLVNYINETDYFCTTSSCSGRIIVICEGNDVVTKKGCQWLYVSHKMTDLASIEYSLRNLQDNTVFKFEPFILHVQCRALEDAKLMHVVAVESGFRNSGITVGKAGKVMVAVRSTHGLEVPLSDGAQLLVSSQYLAFLVQRANSKLQENSKRITRFYTNLMQRLDNYVPTSVYSKLCKNCNRANHQRQSQFAQNTSEVDTSKQNTFHCGYTHREGTGEINRTENVIESSSALQTHGREPTTTSSSCTGQGAMRAEDMVTSVNKTGANNSQGLVVCEAETSLLGNDDSDVAFGFDLFT